MNFKNIILIRCGGKGFTLIELLVVIGITVIMFGLSLFVGNDFYRVYGLSSERDNLISYIRKTRSRALSNYNQSAHGLAATSSQYIIFQGASFAARSSTLDQVFYKSPGISVNWQTEGGLQEIIFSPLAATSSASGTIYLNDGVSTSSIQINYDGRISW